MDFKNDLLDVIRDFTENGYRCYTKSVRTVLQGKEGPRASSFSGKSYFGKYKNIKKDHIDKMLITLMIEGLIGVSYYKKRPFYYVLNEFVSERLQFKRLLIKDRAIKEQTYFDNVNFYYNDDDFISSSKYIQEPILFEFRDGNRTLEFDSKLEVDFIKELYRIDFINDAISQPLTIKYGKTYNRLYTPDFLLKTYDGNTIMIEVKPIENFSNFNNITKFISLKQFSLEREYSYEMIGYYKNEWVTFSELITKEYNKEFEQKILNYIDLHGEIKNDDVQELIRNNNYDERDLVPIIYLNNLDSKTNFLYNIKR